MDRSTLRVTNTRQLQAATQEGRRKAAQRRTQTEDGADARQGEPAAHAFWKTVTSR